LGSETVIRTRRARFGTAGFVVLISLIAVKPSPVNADPLQRELQQGESQQGESQRSFHSQTGSRSEVTVATVRLTAGAGTGPDREYVAEVLDSNGQKIPGADVDIGGLGADPDLRVTTTAMRADKTDSQRYRATVQFPADGDWILVVRVHAPSQAVELFSENILGTGVSESNAHGELSPSRRAVLTADPTFFERYGSGTPRPGTTWPGTTAAQLSPRNRDSLIGHRGGNNDTGRSQRLDLQTVVVAALHSVGAMAWIISMLVLALAQRMGSSSARTEITSFISKRYRLLAAGGLLMTTLTGIPMIFSASAGLATPQSLLRTTMGTTYVAIFAFKLVLVAGSIFTTMRIASALPTAQQLQKQLRLASVGAKANDDMSTYHSRSADLYQLANTNVIIGAAILGCVVVLGQIHHLLP
jgi:hypothetical protein